jgi:NTE family protein
MVAVRGNASLDLAIEHGARLIVCVNPLVPYDLDEADEEKLHIRDMGRPALPTRSSAPSSTLRCITT